MKTLIILSILLAGCATGPTTVIKSGPFTIIEKYPDQLANLKEAPSFANCEWVLSGNPSAIGCE